MAAYYAEIDCLLAPSLRETFGLAAAEALASGCPVIASRVDGLPEVVEDGRSGRCLEPTLPLERYAELGGSLASLPPFSFDPARDALVPPRALDPTALADAVEALHADPAGFEALSRGARARAAARFGFDVHVARLYAALAPGASSGAKAASRT
jgi:glycosyltransferase involved in cell wall biosynthesis